MQAVLDYMDAYNKKTCYMDECMPALKRRVNTHYNPSECP
jgi:hypothetical protein